MWWYRFEVSTTNEFSLIDKDAERGVHTNELKLRMLNKKIKSDFVVAMKMDI